LRELTDRSRTPDTATGGNQSVEQQYHSKNTSVNLSKKKNSNASGTKTPEKLDPKRHASNSSLKFSRQNSHASHQATG